MPDIYDQLLTPNERIVYDMMNAHHLSRGSARWVAWKLDTTIERVQELYQMAEKRLRESFHIYERKYNESEVLRDPERVLGDK